MLIKWQQNQQKTAKLFYRNADYCNLQGSTIRNTHPTLGRGVLGTGRSEIVLVKARRSHYKIGKGKVSTAQTSRYIVYH